MVPGPSVFFAVLFQQLNEKRIDGYFLRTERKNNMGLHGPIGFLVYEEENLPECGTRRSRGRARTR